MRDQICLVTGATSGIGRETAKGLAKMGARVIVVGRNKKKAEQTVTEIQRETDNPNLEYLLADLSVQAEVRRLAKEFQDRYDHLNLLFNNAGAVFLRRQLSADGIEMTWALNHLAYFLLTNLLINSLKASPSARIVSVASSAHRSATINFDDLDGKLHRMGGRRYWGMRAYGQSKLANILFTYELARRLEGTRVTANAVHPGLVATNLARNNGWLVRLFVPIVMLAALSPQEGAENGLYVASAPELEGVSGKYFARKQAVRSSPISYDGQTAKRLWEVSEAMTDMNSQL